MYKKNENIVLRVIPPSYFLVDITKCYNNEVEKMFITDEVGIEIWNAISDGDTFESVFKKFLNKLTDEKTEELVRSVRIDLMEYIELLIAQNCLYEVE